MPLNKPLPQTIAHLQLELAKQQEVLKYFPDATIHYYNGFQSKTVNKSFDLYSFQRDNWAVYFEPFKQIELDFNGTIHTIKISSQPKRSRICFKAYAWQTTKKDEIRFSRVAINMKTHGFVNNNEALISDIRVEITKFIQQNPGMPINDKHLDPRLKKLLAFV